MSKFVAGCSFFINLDPHLWFVLTDPMQDDTAVWYVNLSSHDSTANQKYVFNDPACIVVPGEHRYVVHASCVCYGGAQVASIAQLERRDHLGQITFHDPASATLLQRMRNCAGDSIHTPPDCWQLLLDQNLAS